MRVMMIDRVVYRNQMLLVYFIILVHEAVTGTGKHNLTGGCLPPCVCPCKSVVNIRIFFVPVRPCQSVAKKSNLTATQRPIKKLYKEVL